MGLYSEPRAVQISRPFSGCNPAPGTPCHPNIGVCETILYNMSLLKNGTPVAGASAFSEDVASYIAVPI